MTDWMQKAAPDLHEHCESELRAAFTKLGVEIDIFAEQPERRGVYPPERWDCRHGDTFWVIPSEASIADWEANGLPS